MEVTSQLVKNELERLSLQQKLLKENEGIEQHLGTSVKKLDASVKRNTTLIKRLRNITEESAASLLDDIARTNQSKVSADNLRHDNFFFLAYQGKGYLFDRNVSTNNMARPCSMSAKQSRPFLKPV